MYSITKIQKIIKKTNDNNKNNGEVMVSTVASCCVFPFALTVAGGISCNPNALVRTFVDGGGSDVNLMSTVKKIDSEIPPCVSLTKYKYRECLTDRRGQLSEI